LSLNILFPQPVLRGRNTCQEQGKIDVSVELVSMFHLVGYGVEYTRLNLDMNTNASLYKPYEDFQGYAANSADNLTNKDQEVEKFDHGLNDVDDAVPYTNLYHELHAPRADSDACTGTQNESLSAFEGLMEQKKSRDHYAKKIL
jgi:hypothetical protein